MPALRFLKIEFMDGTTANYTFPAPSAPARSANQAIKQIKLESFFKDRFLILHGDGKLTVFPVENIKSVQMSSDEGELEGIRLPAHAILGARQVD